MKFKQNFKVLIIAVVLIGSFCNLSAKTNVNNIVYNTHEKNGMLVGQTLYKQEGKTLTQYLRYNYVYNNENKIIENNIEKWDNENQTWVNGLTTQYNYNGQKVTTKTYKWDSLKKAYSLMPEKTKQFEDYSL